jgi:hypothetical protein
MLAPTENIEWHRRDKSTINKFQKPPPKTKTEYTKNVGLVL